MKHLPFMKRYMNNSRREERFSIHEKKEYDIVMNRLIRAGGRKMGRIKTKAAILLVLLLLLAGGYMVINDIELKDVPTAIGQTLSQEKEEYTVKTYKITKIEGTEYHGTAANGTKIIFNGDKLKQDLSDVKKGDKIKAYFSKSNRIDGLLKVVKVNE
ncbi:conserved hypothetical protein YpuD [Bacillus velezensis YAU B9601-Y2]|uniref:Uncharacterized protein n=3 Tax=Bacillus amyloliquefaciens group TaxID=1938374 RepID=I2C784_BACAY|nr:conserved hypothetical protein YpuD [Bacillus velezensis YAU B9601-Y2]